MTPTETLRAAAAALRARPWDPTAGPLATWLESWDDIEFSEHGPTSDDLIHALTIARAVLAARPTALPDDLADRYEAVATTAPPLYARHIRDLLRLLMETDAMRAVLAMQAAERGPLAERVRELEAAAERQNRHAADVEWARHEAAQRADRAEAERDALLAEVGPLLADITATLPLDSRLRVKAAEVAELLGGQG